MTDEPRVADLRNELSALTAQVSNHYMLLREITTILGTVSSTLTSANQINAHERESMLARLEAINSELTHGWRRIERFMEDLKREFGDQARGREDAADSLSEIQRHAENISAQVSVIHPAMQETLKHTRKLVDRDPDTGVEISKSDKIVKALSKAFWSAVATGAVFYALVKLYPIVTGCQP